MGGDGSTRWEYHRKKTQVEKCWVLDIKYFNRKKAFRNKCIKGYLGYQSPTLWDDTYFNINFEIKPWGDDTRIMVIRYDILSGFEHEEVEIPILLQKTYPNFGGVRWWFTCPLILDGESCGRRVGKLYLPPGMRYFGCRHCHDLTYKSSQEHDKTMNHFLKNPILIPDAIERKDALSLTAIEAYFKLFGLD